jgi:hypothetical protein
MVIYLGEDLISPPPERICIVMFIHMYIIINV